jgi:hypothetical protein
MIFNSTTAPYHPSYVREAEIAAAPLSMQVVPLPMREPAQIQEGMAKIGEDTNYGLVIIPNTFSWESGLVS